jgi:maltose-binding protein MalE
MERRVLFPIMIFAKSWISRILLLVFLAGCASTASPPSATLPDTLQGRVLLWHAWQGDEATLLATVIARFQALNPDVIVKTQAFTNQDELLSQFRLAAASGLGPDLILAPGEWIRPLQAADLIDEIGDEVEAPWLARYLPASILSLRYQKGLYGLPVTLETMILYYDRRQIEQPPTTLAELLTAASAGQLVEMSTAFLDAFWGVRAFGGQLFDAEQRVILDQGGFAQWLAWLKAARETPGMILESNRTALQERFVNDGIAYYVGSTREYSTILARKSGKTAPLVDGAAADSAVATTMTVTPPAIDPAIVDQIGVALLPNGPQGDAGPFLQVQALLFSRASSPNQRRLALALAHFMTNAEQQATLMREAWLIPANQRVQVNPSLEPVSDIFVRQARKALPLPNVAAMDAVLPLGNSTYAQVLEGLLDPATAAISMTADINDANGFTSLAGLPSDCRADASAATCQPGSSGGMP